MKKKLLLLLIAMCLLLTGCGGGNDASDTPTESPTPEATFTPEPTVSPSPVPTVAASDYEYFIINNHTLGLSFKYPSHWINSPGRSTISFVEPTDPDKTAARIAVTSKLLSDRPTTRDLRLQLESFVEQIQSVYANYSERELSEDYEIMGTTGFSLSYTARDLDSGENITGFVAMVYQKDNRRLYLAHFTAASREYTALRPVLEEILASLTVL